MAYYKIISSPLANISYLQNIEYLEKEWSEKEVIQFIGKVTQIIDILKVNPQTFQKRYKDSSSYKITIIKQITLYYQINKNTVELLLFWNTYQNPEKLKNLI